MGSSTETDDTKLKVNPISGAVPPDLNAYEAVKEGLATILNPCRVKETEDKPNAASVAQAVFYNPIQQFNRDLSVLAIRVFAEDHARIRRARYEKRMRESSSRAGKGKKRKRDDTDRAENGEGSGVMRCDLEKRSPKAEVENSEEHELAASDDGKIIKSNGVSLTKPAESNPASMHHTSEPSNTQDSVEIPRGPKLSHAESEDAKQDKDAKPVNESFRILDALSATGLRALRYAKEIPQVTSVTANDLSASATASIKVNVRHNELEGKVHAVTGNALTHMYRVGNDNKSSLPDGHHGKYDVIDLDPYGTAAPFLDAAVQALYDGGLLCVTCTDSSVFASVGYLEKTYSLYGGLPFKGPQSHEGGLRLILHAIATSAARYGIAIEPLLSLSVDFYARVFVRVRRSPAEVKFLAGKTMLVYNCDSGCGAWTTQFLAHNKVAKDKHDGVFYKYSVGQAPSASPNCQHCGFKTHLSGPMWGGPLHNPCFIQRILEEIPVLSTETYATLPRIDGMLSTALEEILLDPSPDEVSNGSAGPSDDTPIIGSLDPSQPDKCPFFVIPSLLAKVIHCVAPSDAALRGALLGLKYRVTRSHTKPGSIRTDAPWTVIWEVMREWVRQKAPIKPNAIKKGTAGWGIMRYDRSKAPRQQLKDELLSIIARLENEETNDTEIGAALDRARTNNENDRTDLFEPSPFNGTGGGQRKRLDVEFDEQLGKAVDGKKLVRYQLNPRANWGPMARAKGGDSI